MYLFASEIAAKECDEVVPHPVELDLDSGKSGTRLPTLYHHLGKLVVHLGKRLVPVSHQPARISRLLWSLDVGGGSVDGVGGSGPSLPSGHHPLDLGNPVGHVGIVGGGGGGGLCNLRPSALETKAE